MTATAYAASMKPPPWLAFIALGILALMTAGLAHSAEYQPVNTLAMRKIHPVQGDPFGGIIPHVGRYAREAVATAFEMMGGVERLTDWASKNEGEFYTKLLPKIITREVEHTAGAGLEEALAKLDAGEHAMVINATPRSDDE